VAPLHCAGQLYEDGRRSRCQPKQRALGAGNFWFFVVKDKGAQFCSTSDAGEDIDETSIIGGQVNWIEARDQTAEHSHEAVPASRTRAQHTTEGLGRSLQGASVVVDVSISSFEKRRHEFFTKSKRNPSVRGPRQG